MNSTTCARKNKKRFSNEQVKSLEIMFQEDSRPESKTKQEIAEELGLQPRQVAIWFQNRRARSRTKHIEREYNTLKTSYDTLVSGVESLKKENQELNIKLQEVKTLLGIHHQSDKSGLDEIAKAEGGDEAFESKGATSHLLEGSENVVQKEAEVLELARSIDGSLTSSADWCSFDSCCYVDETSCSQWWEFYS